MANLGSGSITVNPKPTDITSIIGQAENAVRAKLQPDVTLNSVLGGTDVIAMTDPSLIGQVLMNLLINAAKNTSKGSITFGYEEYEDELYFFVKDTGAGIDPDLKSKLSDLFDNDNRFVQGLGLGLPMSNAIVKKLGGNIGVESRGHGKGSTFWFTIPYTPVESETPDTTAQASDSGEGVTQTAPDAKPSGRIKILVAEDNESNFLLFNSILKRNYDVVRAVDGLEAVKLFQKEDPDLILMDINMPNMDGYEAVREIRKFSATVPIIAVTAYAFVTDRQRIIENGFNGYVSKPINMGRLEQEINNCLTAVGK